MKKYEVAQEGLRWATENNDEKEAAEARDQMNALILFRTDMATYLRAYSFLSQIFDYGNTDLEKRFIFFKYLVKLLKFGRERNEVDLSEVVLTHHKLRKQAKPDMRLVDGEYPQLSPLSEIGGGEVREAAKDSLEAIIGKLNDLYGDDFSDGDTVAQANAVWNKMLESETLARQATNNTEQQFKGSPDLMSQLTDAIIESMDTQQELGAKALNSKKIRAGLLHLLLNDMGLYDALRGAGKESRE